MTHVPAHELELLLAQASWLRRLAATLAADPSARDDLVQETWLAALESPPSADKPVRAWLATVVRNVARQRRRASARRASREQAAAQGEAVPPAHEVVTGLAIQQELARRVLALDEPYRSTVFQRYYEDLPPREIARRAQIPVKTVKTRIARGIARLRADLDASHGGDRNAWLGALVPFLGRERAAAVYVGALMVNLKVVLVLSISTVCALLAFTFLRAPDTDSVLTSAPATAHAPEELDASGPGEADLASAPRTGTRDAVSAPFTVVSPVTSLPADLVHGRVLDVRGAPVGGVELALREAWDEEAGILREGCQALARSDERGRFEAPAIAGRMSIVLADSAWVTVLHAYLTGEKTQAHPTIVVAARNPLAGTVVGRDGAPIAGAELRIELDDGWRRDVGVALDNTIELTWHAHSDERGHFSLSSAPGAKGKLRVRSPAHQPFELALPDTPVRDLVIELEPLEHPHVVVSGTVVDWNGDPVADAHVALGNRYQKSDVHGAFRFDVTATGASSTMVRNSAGVWVAEDDRTQLRAAKVGCLPALHTLPELSELEAVGVIAPITLSLAQIPLSIQGHVVDHEGQPISGVMIELATTTPFGEIPTKPDRGTTWRVSFEELVRGTPSTDVTTDDHGRFEYDGLLERDYDLFCFDARTLRRVTVPAVHAGDHGVEVRLGAPRELRRIAGRVVGKNGDALAGVDVHPGFQLPNAPERTGRPVRTDAEGRFEFPSLSTDGLGFQLVGDHIFIVFWRTIEPQEDPERLEFVVSRRAFVQIDLGARPGFADHFAPVDARGSPGRIMCFMNAAIFFLERAEIESDRSEVVAVEEDTRAIILYKAGSEVGRVPVAVAPGETVVVRP